MTALPARSILDGTSNPVTSTMKATLGSLRDHLAELLGVDGSPASARNALGVSRESSYKNRIIGGDFSTNPWQRGTSFTGVGTAYTADRFTVSNVSDGVINVLKTADAPTVAQAGIFTQHCLHVDVTTADASIAAGQYALILQSIEGLNTISFGFGQAGTRYLTLSFWHKHTKTGTHCVALRNSAYNRSYLAEYTQAVTNTWEFASITIPVDTSGTWLYDTGIGLNVVFAIACGSTYQAAAGLWQAGNYFSTANQVNNLDNTANDFKIALVQLESGSIATPLETRSVGQESDLCQRYYFKSQTIYGYAPAAASSINWPFSTHVTMRVNPTAAVVYSSVTLASANVRQIGAAVDKAATITANADGGLVTNTAATTSADGIGFIVALDSEL